LDAQFFGVPQRRRRVYLVASFGDWRRSAEVLFEQESLRGNTTPPLRERDNATAHNDEDTPLPILLRGTGWNGGHISQTLDAVLYKRQALPEKNRFPAILVPTWSRETATDDWRCNLHNTDVERCTCPGLDEWAEHDLYPYFPTSLRYLTPRECERLQGFPDDWTAVPYRGKPAADGPRYKAIGNSMAVPVMRWIAERIAAIDNPTTPPETR
jgi:DNA (cytosine-5)-methyltransferase 1